MLFICGNRASGKSEAARVLSEEQSFQVFECGNSMRAATDEYNRLQGTEFTPEEFEGLMVEKSGNQKWSGNYLSSLIANALKKQGDRVAIVGHRNLQQLDYCHQRISEISGLTVPREILFINAPFDIALKRYVRRQDFSSLEEAEEALTAQHKYETEWGVSELLNHADIIVENDCDRNTLRDRLMGATGLLGYCQLETRRVEA